MKKNMSYIHFAIGLLIMLIFRFIPVGVLPNVTEPGLQIMGIFIGTIYLWTTSDPSVASITAIVMIGLSDFTTAGGALVGCFGNATVIQMLFLTTSELMCTDACQCKISIQTKRIKCR